MPSIPVAGKLDTDRSLEHWLDSQAVQISEAQYSERPFLTKKKVEND